LPLEMGLLCCLQQAMLPTGAFAMFGIGPTGLSKAARRAPPASASRERTRDRAGIAAHEVRLPTEHSEIDYLAVCIERLGNG
jgi:hypothetical protein